MAFSLLDHVQTSRQNDIQALLPTVDQDGQRQLLAIVLGQLIVLDRADSPALYQAITAQDHSMFWQGLDDHAISQLAAITTLPVADFKSVINQLYGYVSAEINSLDSTANLEQAGVSELIQGQAEYLAGTAPDQVWSVLNLAELEGQAAPTEAPVDLNASMASLNKMMMDASQMNTSTIDNSAVPNDTVVLENDLHGSHLPDSHQQGDHGHAAIKLSPQRPAPGFFLMLEPLIALVILVALWITYTNLMAY
jgi:hypothetical protein